MTDAPLALVCEDSALIAFGYRDALTEAGLRVELARSPDEALSLADAEPPTVAIVDLALCAKFNGNELANALVARKVPVIVGTGYTLPLAGRLVPNASVVLEKPVNSAALLAAVRAVLGLSK